jgi:uncharacterized protein YecE (DUF72 family)
MTAAAQGTLFQPPARDVSVRVGPAGWNYKDWEGIVYPKGQGKSFDPLALLAEYFDTIEINSSFYSPPRPAAAASWSRRVQHNRRFKFTAKAWQQISHKSGNASPGTLVKACDQVLSSMAPLAEANVLGALLIQFPWSFRCTDENLEYLRRIFQRLGGLPLVLEVRHGTWDRERVFSLLQEHGVAFCNVDQPLIGNSLRPSARVTARVGYFRLHGRNYRNWFREDAGRDARYDYLYSEAEIREITGMIRDIHQTAEETYVVTNNHFRGQALVNALEILEELDASKPAVPPLLGSAYPRLIQD